MSILSTAAAISDSTSTNSSRPRVGGATVRRAKLQDAVNIFELVNSLSGDGTLLRRNYAEICENVRDFVVAAGALLDMKIEWQGEGVEEVGIDAVTGRAIVHVDPRYFRPTEVETLLGDPTKAREKLRWTAEVTFAELVAEMIESDLDMAKRDALVAKEGYKVYSHHE